MNFRRNLKDDTPPTRRLGVASYLGRGQDTSGRENSRAFTAFSRSSNGLSVPRASYHSRSAEFSQLYGSQRAQVAEDTLAQKAKETWDTEPPGNTTDAERTQKQNVLGQMSSLQSRTQFHVGCQLSRCASRATSPTVSTRPSPRRVLLRQ